MYHHIRILREYLLDCRKMTKDFLAPQQQRSRATLARLIKATIDTLETQGLEGATIPRIATAAAVAPATVYRRFRNRDALYRVAFLDALEKSAAANRENLRIESFRDQTLGGIVRSLVHVTMQQYRVQPGLMKALTRFVENDSDDEFRKRALELVSENFEHFIDILLVFKDQIPHQHPRRAIAFALLTMATVVRKETP